MIFISSVTLSFVLDLLRPSPGLTFCPAPRAPVPSAPGCDSGPRPSPSAPSPDLPSSSFFPGQSCWGFCTIVMNKSGHVAGSLAETVRLGVGVMGLAHTRMLHSELAEHWQRVGGSRGPRSPRLGPTEPITQGCQSTDLEPLSGGRGTRGEPAGRLASEGFPGLPPPLLSNQRQWEKAPVSLWDKPVSMPHPWGRNREHSSHYHGFLH